MLFWEIPHIDYPTSQLRFGLDLRIVTLGTLHFGVYWWMPGMAESSLHLSLLVLGFSRL